ncbi:MAG: hypothetical protein HUU38_19040 [Anaerolineales bacterium]|nr:hypothetical protein [Anaerolineales bacterium]
MFYVARWYDPVLGRMAQADTIVPGAGNPMAWDRYAGMMNNPVKYEDPSGHCVVYKRSADANGPLPCGGGGNNDGLGSGGVGGSSGSVRGMNVGVNATGTIASVACADGDCTNEAQVGLNVFQRAAEFGIDTYKNLRALTKGTGLQVHHLIEQRFAKLLGVNPNDIPSVVLTPKEHAQFTRLWSQLIGYDGWKSTTTTSTASVQDIIKAVNTIYGNNPALLQPIMDFFEKNGITP